MSEAILLEDDPNLNLSLRKQLHSFVDKVVSFYSLDEAYQFLAQNTVDLAIIDRQLPDGDGLELVDYLNQTHYFTRTLILSRLGQVGDRIAGLELGADDYLTKPFHPTELKLKVQNLLKKQKLAQSNLIRLGSIKFNIDAGNLVLPDHTTIHLRKKEAQIFLVLAQRINQIVTHEQIVQKVWPGEKFYPSQTTINVYIRRIRLKLKQYKFILETVRQFGYRLNTKSLTS